MEKLVCKQLHPSPSTSQVVRECGFHDHSKTNIIAVYNKWHETELERWLSDHNVPYPTPADRKDLENLVKDNWNDNVVAPYNSWDTGRLQNYLSTKGQQAKKGSEKNKDSLLQSVKAYWYETEEQASDSYSSVRDWIFDR